MPVPGSDCPRGKRQFVSYQAARAAARHHKNYKTLRPFKCAWCMCWHNGNRDGMASKARARR
jgi:hypothetical protein